MTEKLVILDRDGTINIDSDQYIKNTDEWVPLPRALNAIARLTQAGYQVVVVTNQSGIGRGYFDMNMLNAMHEKMRRLLQAEGGRVDAIFYCPHAPEDGCACRKPKAGLFDEVSQRFKMNLAGVPAVGDSLRDLQAAEQAGALPILVRTGKGEKTEAVGGLPAGTQVFDDLGAFVDAWLEREAN